MLNFCARVCSPPPPDPTDRPAERAPGEPTIYRLGTITRWDNISYGWHGNGLLGLGGAACQRHFPLVATFLQHPEQWKRRREHPLLFVYFQDALYEGGLDGGGRSRQQAGKREVRSGMSAGRQEEKSSYPVCASCHRSGEGARPLPVSPPPSRAAPPFASADQRRTDACGAAACFPGRT